MKGWSSYICVIMLVLHSGCSRVESGAAENKYKNQTFIHLYFETEEDCLAAQPPDFFINCHQQVDFLDNNRVHLMLSDIIWEGEYSVERRMIILSFEPNFEIPTGEVYFQEVNGSTLIKVDDNTQWKKMRGNSIWD